MSTLAEPARPPASTTSSPASTRRATGSSPARSPSCPSSACSSSPGRCGAHWLGWNDIFVFLIMYVLTGLGITVGFHRMLTHRAFKTSPFVRGVFTALGSAAIEGPVISWVADHRKHHAFSDRPGRPAQPARRPRLGLCAARCAASLHAHVGWLFLHTHRGRRTRYAPDLHRRPRRQRDRPPLRALRRRRAARAVPARLAVRRHAARRLHRPAVGRRRARARAAPRDVLDQLAVPLLRPPPVRHQGRVAQPVLARRSSRSARPGTTTTTRSRPRPRTGCAAGSSTRRPR